MKTYTIPQTNNKAKVIQYEDREDLLSYDTVVASFNKETKTMTVNGWYSDTTMKHINKFMQLNDQPTYTKKELVKTFNLNK